MIIEADVKCYYCGHISGRVVGDADQPFRPKQYHPVSPAESPRIRQGERLRCSRCGGPVFLDEITILRDRKRAPARSREMNRPTTRVASAT